jgi:hypothetical protein
MKTQEISVTVELGGTIRLPHELAEKFKPGQALRLVAILDDESEEQLWLRVGAEHFFAGDDPADELYADYARHVTK